MSGSKALRPGFPRERHVSEASDGGAAVPGPDPAAEPPETHTNHPWEVCLMKTSILRALTITAASLLAVVAASASGASGAARGATFTDPSGDVQGAAADITSVVVGDEPVSGTITLSVTAAGYAAVPDGTKFVYVYLNTDKNPLTGASGPGGAEVVLAAAHDAGDSGWAVLRWDGSQFVLVPQTATLGFTRSGDTLTWTFNKSDVGGSSGFTFIVTSVLLDASDNLVGRDFAPDEGSWTYDLSSPPPPAPVKPAAPVKPLIGAPSAGPAKPVAGKSMTVVFPVSRSDTGAALVEGTMICDPSVAGTVVRHTERFADGKARLSFVVPKSAKGRQLKVKVTIKLGTQSATRIATYRVG